MYTKVYLIVFIGSLFLLQAGMKAKKIERTRQAGNLLTLLGVCIAISSLLGIIIHILKVATSWKNVILIVQMIIGVVCLGIGLVMQIFGYFKLLEKSREIPDENSQNESKATKIENKPEIK